MKTWIIPTGLVVALALAVAGASLSPAVPLPREPMRESSTRVSVVCPSFQTATATVRVAAVAVGQPVRTSKLSAPQKATQSDRLAIVQNPGQPVRVSVQDSQLFGATTASAAAEGPARGLALASCLAPQADHWFTGVDVSAQAQSELVLVNLDSTEALVDLVAYGAGGRISAPRGLTVAGASSTSISLGVLKRQPDPVTLQVSTSQGRVAAFVRQLTWQGATPYGADWVPDGLGAQTVQVIPGVPSGKGRRTLVVANPGDRVADVQLEVLGPTGLTQLADARNVEVPPGVTRAVDVATGLGGGFAGLRLTSNTPVTAGMLADNGLANAGIDTAVLGPAPALPTDAVWPVAWGTATVGLLQLVNSGAQDATVQLSTTVGPKGQPKVSDVKIPANSAVQVKLPKADALTLGIHTDSDSIQGSLQAIATAGKVKGLAVLDLVADETRVKQSAVVFDPHLS